MSALPLLAPEGLGESHGCGRNCGAGMERVYPTTAVRWGAMNWIGEFSYRGGTVFRCGAKVVIETERGIELGQQVSLSCDGCNRRVSREQVRAYIETSGAEYFRLGSGKILREAGPRDVEEHERLNATVLADVDRAALLAAQLGLDMKVVTCEHLLGGERIVFYFNSEQRVDFRELVRELARHYQTRIEMRQVGARDEARLVADYEICGRECCCKNFLKKLRPVGMRMAKLQKTTLDPAKLSGRCGRLRCCLRYEHEGYEELDRKLPRIGARVETAVGPATVVDRQILTQLLLVRSDDGRELAVPLEEVRSAAPPRTAPLPPDAPERDAADEPAPRAAEPPAEDAFEPRDDAPRRAPRDAAHRDGGHPPARKRRRRRRPRRPEGPPTTDPPAPEP